MVFCKDCIYRGSKWIKTYYKIGLQKGFVRKRICKYPENIIRKNITFENCEIEFKQEASDLNKNNNCKWYFKDS